MFIQDELYYSCEENLKASLICERNKINFSNDHLLVHELALSVETNHRRSGNVLLGVGGGGGGAEHNFARINLQC